MTKLSRPRTLEGASIAKSWCACSPDGAGHAAVVLLQMTPATCWANMSNSVWIVQLQLPVPTRVASHALLVGHSTSSLSEPQHEEVPCHFIPLNEAGDTIESLGLEDNEAKLEREVKD